MGFFKNLFKFPTPMTDYERYLAASSDIYDLERRQKDWLRGKR